MATSPSRRSTTLTITSTLDNTQLECMFWRHQTGEDLDEMGTASRQIIAEEKMMKDGGLIPSLLQMWVFSQNFYLDNPVLNPAA